MKFKRSSIVVACLMATVAGSAMASSHREAPFITTSPKVDGTDFYMFRSYEGVDANGKGGRSDYVTLIANYQPLQGPYGGPNYFSMDPNALYEIHIDNNGNAVEDITFQFRFTNKFNNLGVNTDAAKPNEKLSIPLIQLGGVSGLEGTNLNLKETYTVNVVRGDRRKGSVSSMTKADGSTTVFEKPVDNIGAKTFGTQSYETYANLHVHEMKFPNCDHPGKVFVGQRKEGFAVNLGTVFDLVNAPVSFITDPMLKNEAVAKDSEHYIQKNQRDQHCA